MIAAQIAAILGLVVVVGLIVAIRVWWRRHRSRETGLQKALEDREIEAETQIW